MVVTAEVMSLTTPIQARALMLLIMALALVEEDSFGQRTPLGMASIVEVLATKVLYIPAYQ